MAGKGVISIRLGTAAATIPFTTKRSDSLVVEELRREIRMLIVSDKELQMRRLRKNGSPRA